MAIGNIVHVLAERAARGDIAAEPSSLLTEVDRVWAELAFDTSWEADAERDDVAAALGRLCAYLQGSPRRMLAVEQDFLVTIPLHTPIEATGDTEYVARGAIDRIEIDVHPAPTFAIPAIRVAIFHRMKTPHIHKKPAMDRRQMLVR